MKFKTVQEYNDWFYRNHYLTKNQRKRLMKKYGIWIAYGQGACSKYSIHWKQKGGFISYLNRDSKTIEINMYKVIKWILKYKFGGDDVQ